MTLRNHR